MAMTREERNARQRVIQTAIRDRRKAQGLCYKCGNPLPEGAERGKMCPRCQKKYSEWRRRFRLERIMSGICVFCGKPARPDRETCAECGARRNAESKEYQRRLKARDHESSGGL